MLPTCIRCRLKRTKCDSELPACGRCTKAKKACIIHDNVIGENVPRSYIQGLHDRISQLKSRLRLQDSYSLSTENLQQATNVQNDQILGPHLRTLTWVLEASIGTISTTPGSWPWKNTALQGNCEISRDYYTDRTLLTPKIVRHLLDVYDHHVRPVYWLPSIKAQKYQQNMQLGQIDPLQRFQVLILCAISAHALSWNQPNWLMVARCCREWSNELAPSIITKHNKEALVAVILLCIHEMVDPSQGIIWELIDLAIMIALKIGWHLPYTYSEGSNSPSDIVPGKEEIMEVLKSLIRQLTMVFERPTMLDELIMSTDEEEADLFRLYMHTSGHLRQPNRMSQENICPAIGDNKGIIETLYSSPRNNTTVQATWLLFLPLCIQHSACPHCMDNSPIGVPSSILPLREKIVDAASDIINSVHGDATSGRLIFPMIASIRVLEAGCVVLVALKKHWKMIGDCMKTMLQCSEVLMVLRFCWEGGPEIFHVWSSLYTQL